MVIVSDTSCISNLYQIGKLNLLQQVFGQILIPEIVHKELLQFHDTAIIAQLNMYSIFIERVKDLEILEKVKTFNLDIGETEAISLALQYKDSVLIIDERAGNKIASNLGIRTVGTLGVIITAKEKGLINFVKPLFDDLKNKTNFFFSPKLYFQLLNYVGE